MPKRHGLVCEVNLQGFPASKEYHAKTTRLNGQGKSDASYFFVLGWGRYYLISVLDDCSRMILPWELKMDMNSALISEVMERAVEDRTPLVSSNGSSYLFTRIRELFVDIANPVHPGCAASSVDERQDRAVPRNAEGTTESLGYTKSQELRPAMAKFIESYNLTPWDARRLDLFLPNAENE